MAGGYHPTMPETALRFCPQCLMTRDATAQGHCPNCGSALLPLLDEAGALSRGFLAARGSCCDSGCRNCPYGSNKTCRRCGEPFECRVGERCWCEAVRLSPEALQHLRRTFSDCLCTKCLSSFVV